MVKQKVCPWGSRGTPTTPTDPSSDRQNTCSQSFWSSQMDDRTFPLHILALIFVSVPKRSCWECLVVLMPLLMWLWVPAACRRSDLEILSYCMVQWLCGRLPWEDKLQDPTYVRDSKIRWDGITWQRQHRCGSVLCCDVMWNENSETVLVYGPFINARHSP